PSAIADTQKPNRTLNCTACGCPLPRLRVVPRRPSLESEIVLNAELDQARVECRGRPQPRRAIRSVIVVGPQRVTAVQDVIRVEVHLELAAAPPHDLTHPEVELVD